MGRPRTKNKHLPPRVYFKHGAYYYVDRAGQWHRLGANLPDAMAEWAKLVEAPVTATRMQSLFDRYMLEIAPRKAPRTYKDNKSEIKALRVFFGDMKPEDVEPRHVYEFLEIRGQTAPVRANRERALLSHVFTKAMQWGVLRYNPCRGVKRITERPAIATSKTKNWPPSCSRPRRYCKPIASTSTAPAAVKARSSRPG
ncbi:hypothetical protein [Alkalilimnicola ehrlichii]|uniref:hypothetical protein n=1 Tax=Alkalilimnicola ehrlichii TaxID=351052 RepID=UPI0015F25164|nr:hypothetical protein [Alkalilimnicola ehrlichii]